MLCLEVLGGLSVERTEASLPSPDPRRRLLALLALIAGHDPPAISRDKLLAYLWPESDTRRARNSLKQALSSIRRSLGAPVVDGAGGVLHLNPAFITVDLWTFEAALARGDEAAAVRAYRGPFLDGFFLSGLGEFERWKESERARLARRYSDALRALATRSDRNEDRLAAVSWWRQLTLAEPLCSTAAVGLMRALVAAGDPTGAREHARNHAAYVRAELGGPVAESVVAFANRLREEPTPRQAISVIRPAPRGLLWPSTPRSDGRTLVEAATISLPGAPAIPAVPRWTWWVVAALWTVALLLNLVRWSAGRGAVQAAASAEPTSVSVAPFSVAGDPSSGELGRGLKELLEARLDGTDGLRTLFSRSPVAQLSPARLQVRGQLFVAGGRLRAVATLYDRGNAHAAIARAQAEVEASALFDLADALATQLIAEHYRGPHERLTRSAVTSTRSLPALKAYLLGQRRFQADSYPAAIDAFRQAVRADTSFALAYYGLSQAADWDGRRATAIWAAQLAARFSDRLSDHDRRLVEAYLVQRLGRPEEAERLYREIVVDYPDDADAWFQLGEVLFRSNPLLGRSAEESAPAFERVLALEPGNKEALMHLARVFSLRGDQQRADSLVRRISRATTDSAVLALRTFRTFALGDRPGRNGATRGLIAHPGQVPSAIALQAAVFVDDLTGVEHFAELLADERRSCELRGLGRRMLAQAQLARGRPRAARARLAAPERCDAAAWLELRALYAALPFVTVPRRELKAVLQELTDWDAPATRSFWEREAGAPTPATLRLYELGLVALQLGDTLGARRAASDLARRSDRTAAGEVAWSFSHSLRARVALDGGRPAQALSYLENARWERTAGRSLAEASDRFLRAELLRQLGRVDEAFGWYRSIGERSSYELVYLAPSQLRLAQIADLRGDTRQAIAHYRRFRELWRKAEPEFRPLVTEAEQRLKALAAAD